MLMNAQALLERFHNAMNEHDIEKFAGCFAPDYSTTQPTHPNRAFVGGEIVRKNWERMFSDIPDFGADLLRSVVMNDTIWCEFDWHGTRTDGTPYHAMAMSVFGVRGDQFAWGRVYMEPVEVASLALNVKVRWTGEIEREDE